LAAPALAGLRPRRQPPAMLPLPLRRRAAKTTTLPPRRSARPSSSRWCSWMRWRSAQARRTKRRCSTRKQPMSVCPVLGGGRWLAFVFAVMAVHGEAAAPARGPLRAGRAGVQASCTAQGHSAAQTAPPCMHPCTERQEGCAARPRLAALPTHCAAPVPPHPLSVCCSAHPHRMHGAVCTAGSASCTATTTTRGSGRSGGWARAASCCTRRTRRWAGACVL
jgi:hypothetical protein